MIDPFYIYITQLITVLLLIISEYLGLSKCPSNGVVDALIKNLPLLLPQSPDTPQNVVPPPAAAPASTTVQIEAK